MAVFEIKMFFRTKLTPFARNFFVAVMNIYVLCSFSTHTLISKIFDSSGNAVRFSTTFSLDFMVFGAVALDITRNRQAPEGSYYQFTMLIVDR